MGHSSGSFFCIAINRLSIEGESDLLSKIAIIQCKTLFQEQTSFIKTLQGVKKRKAQDLREESHASTITITLIGRCSACVWVCNCDAQWLTLRD